MMNLEQCCRKVIYDILVKYCVDAECFRDQSKVKYYSEENRVYAKNYFIKMTKKFNRDFIDIKKFLNGSNHLTRKLRRRIIAEARYKFHRELRLEKLNEDISWLYCEKPLNFVKNSIDPKYDNEQTLPKYDIHLLD